LIVGVELILNILGLARRTRFPTGCHLCVRSGAAWSVLALGRNTFTRQKHEPEWSSKRAPTVAGRGYFECL